MAHTDSQVANTLDMAHRDSNVADNSSKEQAEIVSANVLEESGALVGQHIVVDCAKIPAIDAKDKSNAIEGSRLYEEKSKQKYEEEDVTLDMAHTDSQVANTLDMAHTDSNVAIVVDRAKIPAIDAKDKSNAIEGSRLYE